MRAITQRDLDNWFTYHPPTEDQRERYELLRAKAKEFAEEVLRLTSPGPDQSAAIRKIREAVFVANAAIACDEWKDNIADVEAIEGGSPPSLGGRSSANTCT